MNKLSRRLVALAAFIGAAAGAYRYLIDDEAKAIIKRTAIGISDTARAIAGKLTDELGQVIREDPELAQLRESLAENWSKLGY